MSKQLKNTALVAGAILTATAATGAIAYATSRYVREADKDDTKLIANNDSTVSSTLMDETVYILSNAEGGVQKVINSTWNKTADDKDEYNKTESADKSTPIDMKVSYLLDGKTISPRDLAGKSGKVTVRYEFTNKERSGGFYMPYVIMTGAILDNNRFSNVSVTNGKILNDGNRTIVAGVTLPGMQENLGIDKSTIDIPSYFEFTADVKDFRLDITISLASSKVFSELNLDSVASIADLESQLGKLSDAMSQLVGGSSTLAKGMNTLYDKVKTLPDGINALADGASRLKTGAIQIDAGVGQLQGGVQSLYDGINSNLVSKNATLQAGARGIFQSSLDTANNTIVDGEGHKLSDLIALHCGPTHGITEFTVDNYGVEAEVAPGVRMTCMAMLASQSAQLEPTREKLDGLNSFYTGLVAYTNGVAQTNEGVIKGQILEAITKDDGLKAGTAALAEGATTLDTGVSTLKESSSALLDGIGQLRDGSYKLADGVQQFSNEGIQKLINVYQGDVKDLVSRIRTISNLSKNGKKMKYIYRTDEIN